MSPGAMSVSTTAHLSIEVLTRSGRAQNVDFRLNAHTVEVWHRGSTTGLFDRHDLARWLRTPSGRVRGTAMEFLAGIDQQVSITLFEVEAWRLSPVDVSRLRELVQLP